MPTQRGHVRGAAIPYVHLFHFPISSGKQSSPWFSFFHCQAGSPLARSPAPEHARRVLASGGAFHEPGLLARGLQLRLRRAATRPARMHGDNSNLPLKTESCESFSKIIPVSTEPG